MILLNYGESKACLVISSNPTFVATASIAVILIMIALNVIIVVIAYSLIS